MTQPFTFYVIQFAHTDIGYTHPQDQIKQMYLEFYDKVLELCERTQHDPEEHRFKWVCETAWQVRHYLEHRPEREAEFVACALRGQIEVTASYLHFTDLLDEDAVDKSLEWVLGFCKKHALPLKTAMHCDINGWPWALADVLAKHGVRYFSTHVHLDSATNPLGKRGSVHYNWLYEWNGGLRLDAPIRVPEAFNWRGPGGGEVLTWMGEHHHLGNFLGVSSPYGFHADKSRRYWETDPLGPDDLYAVAQRELPRYLERLRNEGFTLDATLLTVGGFYVDNACPDDRWCEVIRRWNLEHQDIQVRTATLSEWFEHLALQQNAWPTHAVAWPDGWAHGLGSSTERVAQARRTQRRRAGVTKLVKQAQNPEAHAQLELALEQERLALEHTFSAWSTTARPASPLNAYQQSTKELCFHRAELHLDEAVSSALHSLVPAGVPPRLYASLESEVQTLRFNAFDTHPDPQRWALEGVDGERHPFQLEFSDPPTFVASLKGDDLSAFRLTEFALTEVTGLVEAQPARAGRGAVSQSAASHSQTDLETGHWKLSLDPQTGGLSSLRDASGREWVAPGPFGFGQLVREQVVHPLGREASGNVGRFVALGVASEAMRQHLGDAPVYAHQTLALSGALSGQAQFESGGVFDALELRGESLEFGKVRVQWRAYHATPLIELVLEWDKPWSELPEAAYVAFPFAAQGLQLETGGGFFQPGSHEAGGQLPGTVSSFYTVQRAARVTNGDASLLWLPLDAPLVMTQEINWSRWETDPYAWNGFLASMPVNHYWHTNFPTSQRGPLRLRYRFYAGPLEGEAAIRAALPIEALGWR